MNLVKKLKKKIEDKKEERIETQYEKTHNRLITAFHKKIGVTKEDSQEEINHKTLKYVRENQDKQQLFEVILTDKQYEDCEFLLAVYRANPVLAILKQPREQHENNAYFMVEYLKVLLKGYESSPLGGQPYTIEDCLSKRIFAKTLRNFSFLERLSKEFPEENIVKYLTKIQYDLYEYPPQNRVEKICSQLSNEFFQAQVSRFGAGALKHLPPKMINGELVSLGIKQDGFDSLKFLNIDSLLDNKGLILLATKHDGAAALKDYIYKSLSPNREHNYWCHGEPHLDRYYSLRHKTIQDKLIADPEIQQILEELKQEQATSEQNQ